MLESVNNVGGIKKVEKQRFERRERFDQDGLRTRRIEEGINIQGNKQEPGQEQIRQNKREVVVTIAKALYFHPAGRISTNDGDTSA